MIVAVTNWNRSRGRWMRFFLVCATSWAVPINLSKRFRVAYWVQARLNHQRKSRLLICVECLWHNVVASGDQCAMYRHSTIRIPCFTSNKEIGRPFPPYECVSICRLRMCRSRASNLHRLNSQPHFVQCLHLHGRCVQKHCHRNTSYSYYRCIGFIGWYWKRSLAVFWSLQTVVSNLCAFGIIRNISTKCVTRFRRCVN